MKNKIVSNPPSIGIAFGAGGARGIAHLLICLLYTSDAADERSSVEFGGRRIIKKKRKKQYKKE